MTVCTRRDVLRLAPAAALLPHASVLASSGDYPSKPVSVIVPFGAGSSTD